MELRSLENFTLQFQHHYNNAMKTPFDVHDLLPNNLVLKEFTVLLC